MSFIDKLNATMENLGKKTEDVVEITKLKLQKGKIERQKEMKLTLLGEYVYKSYVSNEKNGEAVINLCEEIIGLDKEIQNLDRKIEQFQSPEKTCPQCNKTVEPADSYCGSCGCKLEHN